MNYAIDVLCATMQISRSAYYAYQKGKTYVPKVEKVVLAQEVKTIFEIHKRCYGSRRIHHSLNQKGIKVGRYAIRSLMHKQGLQAIQPKSFVPKTTNSKHKLGYSPNLLADKNGSFPTKTNQVYVGDITYLPLKEGKFLYLNMWMDLYSRTIVGWKIDVKMDDTLVIDSLKQAIFKRNPKAGLIIHSDRGGQYASIDFRILLEKYNFKQSMSAADNPYDNAFAESFFSRFKAETELKMAFEDIEEARKKVFEYIEMYYNTQRLHSGIGYETPLNFERKTSKI